jgi:hypothetical protein
LILVIKLIYEMTGGKMIVIHGFPLWLLFAAKIGRYWTAGMKGAAAWRVRRAWNFAF